MDLSIRFILDTISAAFLFLDNCYPFGQGSQFSILDLILTLFLITIVCGTFIPVARRYS